MTHHIAIPETFRVHVDAAMVRFGSRHAGSRFIADRAGVIVDEVAKIQMP